jgi:hypothetical protein
MQAIEETPPPASAPKITPAAEVAASAKAATAEATNLESTLSDIDKVLLDLAAEEAAASADEVLATVPEKGKEVAKDISEEKDFNFQNIISQELSKSEKEELQEYAISCGYQPGAMLFGGINEETLGCIRDRTGAKIISTLSKSVGFPKLETDISRYRRQHIVGSLFYSNFKVMLLGACLVAEGPIRRNTFGRLAQSRSYQSEGFGVHFQMHRLKDEMTNRPVITCIMIVNLYKGHECNFS